MALIWPARVPSRLNRTGATLAYEDARQRSNTSDGPGRLRRRAALALRPFSGSIDMSAAEHAYFNGFWNVDTRAGVLPFWFPDPLRRGMPLLGDAALAPLLTADGRVVLLDAWLLCQFGDQAPQSQPLPGGRLRVQISFVELP